MKSSNNRKLALLVLAAVSFSFIGLGGPAAGAQTLDITDLRISPNPGYSCENTTISFNVTNNLGTMVDRATVSVSTKSSAGGASWQSNITLLSDGASSFQSFLWTNPPEGTYDVSITVMGAGQISQKSGIYSVLPCAAHVYIGSVTIVKSQQAPDNNATVSVEVGNDGHAQANNTTVAVQAAGPYPDTTNYFIGSTVISQLEVGKIGRVDVFWQKLPLPGVYNLTAMAIEENGNLASQKNKVITLQPEMNSVEIRGITIDPYPPMEGQESNVTAELVFHGNWTGMDVVVKAYADGPSSYLLLNITLHEVLVSGIVPVKFPWLSTIEPGEYNLTVSVFGFDPMEVTSAKTIVRQIAKQKTWLPSNFKLDIKGLRISPYPPSPGQNITVTVEIENTGELAAPPANLTVTAVGPAFYNLGTRQTPKTDFGSIVRMDFAWKQPFVPGGYVISAYLEDPGGNQSELRHTFVLPHVLDSNLTVVNGTVVNGSVVNNYYNYGVAPNCSKDQNITVIVPTTLNETKAAAGLANPTVAGAAGVAAGAVVSLASVLGYAMVKGRGKMGEFSDRSTSQWGTKIRESPTRPSQGQTAVRESPSKASDGRTSIRERPTQASSGVVNTRDLGSSGMATGKRQHGPVPVEDEDGDTSSDSRMAINEKGLPGKKTKPSAQREMGDGTEPLDPDDDDDGVPDVQGMAINEKGLPGDKKPKKTTSQARTAGGGEPLDDDSDDDGTPEYTSKKGYDYYKAKSDMAAPQDIRESPTKASTGQTAARESPSKQSLGQTAARESPTKASRGQTSLRESPTLAPRDRASGQASGIAIDEPGTHAAAPRDVATGQSSGKRMGIGDTTPENPTGKSDFAIKEQGVKAMKEEGGRHTPFHNRLAPEEAEGIDGTKGHRDVGGYRATEAPPTPPAQAADGRVSGSTNDSSGAGSRAQDHNSSRSNKTSSIAAPDGGGGAGTGTGGAGADGKLTAGDLEAKKHTKTGHVTLMK